MVVGRRVQQRWLLAAALDLGPAAAAGPELAASRLAHPSTVLPDVIVLVVDGAADLAWLQARTRRTTRGWVPVVAVVTRPQLAPAARAAGARATVPLREHAPELADGLRRAITEATTPATVIHLDPVRTA